MRMPHIRFHAPFHKVRTELVDRGVVLTEDQATLEQIVPLVASKMTDGATGALEGWVQQTALGLQGLQENPPRMDVEAVKLRLQSRAVPVTRSSEAVVVDQTEVAPVTPQLAVTTAAPVMTELALTTSSVLEEGTMAEEAATMASVVMEEEAPVVEEEASPAASDNLMQAADATAGQESTPAAVVTTEDQWLAAAAAAAAAEQDNTFNAPVQTTASASTVAEIMAAKEASQAMESTSTSVSQALPALQAITEEESQTKLDVILQAKAQDYASPAPLVFDKYFTNTNNNNNNDQVMAEAFDVSGDDMQEVGYYGYDTSLF